MFENPPPQQKLTLQAPTPPPQKRKKLYNLKKQNNNLKNIICRNVSYVALLKYCREYDGEMLKCRPEGLSFSNVEALAKFIDSIGCQHGAWDAKMAKPPKKRGNFC